MKLSDYVAHFLATHGIKHVFCVQGGACAHLIDSVGEHPDLEYICPAHEQAAAFAVDGYYRVNQQMACAIATTGPGVMNLMTGIACLYYDSLPGIFIGGQVSTFRLSRNAPGVRQLGFQESPHIQMVQPITKYAALVDKPETIRFHLEKAFHYATTGRMGPVFLDICDDVQRVEIEPDQLEGYEPYDPGANTPWGSHDPFAYAEQRLRPAIAALQEAKRPVLVFGAAIRTRGLTEQALKLARDLDVPVCPTWAMQDCLGWGDPLNAGPFGISGSRRGNFAVQNADVIVSIGSRLDTHATGSPLTTFGRGAKIFVIESEWEELQKFPAHWNQLSLAVEHALPALAKSATRPLDIEPWRQQIAHWRTKYPAVTDSHRSQTGSVSPYAFIEALSDLAPADSIIIPDCGGNLIQTFQAWKVKKGQKLFSAFNCSPMGYSLSASIGACLANDRKPVICIIGDGGLQVNMQELATIARYDLPIKIFLLNNHGYGIIQQTQDDWLGGRYHGSRVQTGLAEPDYCGIARSCGFSWGGETNGNKSVWAWIQRSLARPQEPTILVLRVSPSQRLDCILKAGRPIEDANPLLPRDEFRENMIVEPLPASDCA